MPAVVSLQDVVAAMDVANRDWESFLDPDSGEIVTVTDDDRSAIEDPEPDLLPEWQRALLPKIREALASERHLRLPDSFEVHEWSIMQRFCLTIDDPPARDELLDAIHGSGAFRVFRQTVERLALRDAWHAYRQSAFERIARDWLDAHGVPYK
jgi:hypothetical protein